MNKPLATTLLAALIAANVALGTEMKIAKVHALADGSINLDGRHTTLDELQRILSKAHGQVAVWYYRDHAHREPTEGQMNVIKTIIDNQAPISMSTKPDFSDVVGPHGQSGPRNRAD